MKTSFQLMQKYLDINSKPEELIHLLTMNGPEVEGFIPYAVPVDNVVVGEISIKDKHPDADKLTLCKVNIGTEELQIICGATNHNQGDKVAIATVGATLPNGLKIKKAKLRGVESFGMICSKTELGLESSSDGVWILNKEAVIGESIHKYMPKEDLIYDVTLTANRSDCLSNIGLAREVGIIENKNIQYPEIKLTVDKSIETPDIKINDQDLCYRYSSRIIKGIKVSESPDWLKEALLKYGARPINNIVDITNYVLFELGQPLHAFDLNKLNDKKIIVRKAGKDKKIVSLDEKERALEEDMLIIADAQKPIAIAGVMGGFNSEVDNDTIDLLMESAYFLPASIRKTSKKLGIRSEASYRFERDVDPENIIRALDLATSLIVELAGGKVSELVDNYPNQIKASEILLRKNFLDQMLGFSIADSEIERMLKLLEFNFVKKNDDYQITFPTFRRDCYREIDAVEEIIRAYGYDKIPETIYSINVNKDNFKAEENTDHKIRNFFHSFGINEAYNFSFSNEVLVKKFNLLEDKNVFKLKNPLNQDYDTLRTGLFPSLISNLKMNNDKGNQNVALFEIGKAFWCLDNSIDPEYDNFTEKKKLGIILSGEISESNWALKSEEYDFYFLKGILQELLISLRKSNLISYKAGLISFLHPGKTAYVYSDDNILGFMGEIHPDVKNEYGMKRNCVYAEIDFDLLEQIKEDKLKYSIVSKYQDVEREIAFIVDSNVEAAEIEVIIANESKLIKKIDVYDVYKGNPIPEDKKSIAFKFILQADDKTLTDNEIHKIMDSIINKAGKKVGATLREA